MPRNDNNEPRVALITGAARRIGAAIAQDLAAHGFAVALHANHSVQPAEALAHNIEQAGGQAMIVTGNLLTADAPAAMIDAVHKKFGRLDILVNNASLFKPDGIGDLDLQRFDDHIRLHVRAPLFLADVMVARHDGHTPALIVNMIDQRVWRLTPRYLSYTLSKAAMWTATQTLAQALAPMIRVNAIGPGPTLRHAAISPTEFTTVQRKLLLEDGPALAEFGRTIRYIWETPSITGPMIALDGGQHLAWETPECVDFDI